MSKSFPSSSVLDSNTSVLWMCVITSCKYLFKLHARQWSPNKHSSSKWKSTATRCTSRPRSNKMGSRNTTSGTSSNSNETSSANSRSMEGCQWTSFTKSKTSCKNLSSTGSWNKISSLVEKTSTTETGWSRVLETKTCIHRARSMWKLMNWSASWRWRSIPIPHTNGCWHWQVIN